MTLLPDMIRAAITGIMMALMLYIMSTPKYDKKWIYILITAVAVVVTLLAKTFLYISGDYSSAVKADLVVLIGLAILYKPFFKDTVMQWLFTCITVMNTYAMIVFLGYFIADFFPSPAYGSLLIRFVLFSIIILIFSKKLGSLYRQTLEFWKVFFPMTIALFGGYLYYFIIGGITETMTENHTDVLLLIVITFSIYVGIFLSLKIILAKYYEKKETIRLQSQQELLTLAADAMGGRIRLQEETRKLTNEARQERRTISENVIGLLRHGKINQAILELEKRATAKIETGNYFCENVPANSVVSYYSAICQQAGVSLEVKLDIPKHINCDSQELAVVFSSLIENSLKVCKKTVDNSKKTITLSGKFAGALTIEIKNNYEDEVPFDSEGYPLSSHGDYGFGTKCLKAFVEKERGKITYTTSDNVFAVKLVV